MLYNFNKIMFLLKLIIDFSVVQLYKYVVLFHIISF